MSEIATTGGTYSSDQPAREAAAPAARPESAAARVLPQSVEAEACVLGAMMLEPATIDIAVQIVQSDDFFRPSHRIIFDTLCAMHDMGKPIEVFTVIEELTRLKLLDRVGGQDYLGLVIEGVPSIANVEYYAKGVRDKALLRKLIVASQQIAGEAYDSQDEPAEILDRAENTVFQLAQRKVGEGASTLESLLQQTFETLQNSDGTMLTGLGTGYFKLDELTSGFQKGEMIVVAARPSMGKTAFACNIAEYMAVDDHRPTLMFSLEMSQLQVAQRFLCSRARFSSMRLRRGNITPEDWTQLQAAAGELEKAPLLIDDTASLNILQLRAKARRLFASHGIQCIFVDYLQLMSATRRVDSRQQEISEISRGMKALARELNLPVIVLSQLNRGPEDREGHRPRMSDLRESGAIEQDADVVILLHREDYYHRGEADYVPTNVTEVIIAKQRNGPTDTVHLTFVGESMRFENMAAGSGYGS